MYRKNLKRRENLKQLHSATPVNSLLADPLYIPGYIEQLDTGTEDIVRIAREVGLKDPEFIQEGTFKEPIYRPSIRQVTGEVTVVVPQEYHSTFVEVRNLIIALGEKMNRKEVQRILELKHEDNFRNNYLMPSPQQGFIEMIYPDKPNHPKQKYYLTEKGKKIKQQLG